MKYLVAKAPSTIDGKMKLYPNWFSIENDGGNFARIASEEYLKTRDAKRNNAIIVECEITEIDSQL